MYIVNMNQSKIRQLRCRWTCILGNSIISLCANHHIRTSLKMELAKQNLYIIKTYKLSIHKNNNHLKYYVNLIIKAQVMFTTL